MGAEAMTLREDLEKAIYEAHANYLSRHDSPVHVFLRDHGQALVEILEDSERYRAIRAFHSGALGDKKATVVFWNDHGPYEPSYGPDLDSAIDAAMKGER
jgi:hypothetical protein